jgi:hypothetical protein
MLATCGSLGHYHTCWLRVAVWGMTTHAGCVWRSWARPHMLAHNRSQQVLWCGTKLAWSACKACMLLANVCALAASNGIASWQISFPYVTVTNSLHISVSPEGQFWYHGEAVPSPVLPCCCCFCCWMQEPLSAWMCGWLTQQQEPRSR